MAAAVDKKEDHHISKIASSIRVIPNFPKPGVMFQDIRTPLLEPKTFRDMIDLFVAGRAGVPMEVMGLMLGEFVEYTVRVVDVLLMLQSGTGISVEAVDHVFHTNMLDLLKQTGRHVGLGENRSLIWVEGDAEALSFKDGSMDGYIIAFGIRIVTRIEKVLMEAYREAYICASTNYVSSDRWVSYGDVHACKSSTCSH